jgi:hypothetical protein
MRRFKIGSASMRAAAFVLLVLGSLIGLGADRASAQYSYYFDFTARSSPSPPTAKIGLAVPILNRRMPAPAVAERCHPRRPPQPLAVDEQGA